MPHLANRIQFLHGDANNEVARLCKNTVWKNETRALIFLDPFGAQVEWNTIELIAATEAVDLWYLFPLMAIVRMTPRDGRIPDAWARRLDKMLGDPGWRDAFYTQDSEPDLFGDRALHKATRVENVERYLLSRLKSVFPAVANQTLRLPEAEGRSMFLLVFACANPAPKAMGLALKIANDILGR
jgi:three-Cys-motif partner protein